MVQRIVEELGYDKNDVTVVATGGLAELIHTHSETIGQVDQMLTLKGLLTIYKRNEKLHHTNGMKLQDKGGALC